MSIMNPIAIKEILEKHYIINFTNESKVNAVVIPYFKERRLHNQLY